VIVVVHTRQGLLNTVQDEVNHDAPLWYGRQPREKVLVLLLSCALDHTGVGVRRDHRPTPSVPRINRSAELLLDRQDRRDTGQERRCLELLHPHRNDDALKFEWPLIADVLPSASPR
jgi:hypothetical protein